jgi:hypothetical protein
VELAAGAGVELLGFESDFAAPSPDDEDAASLLPLSEPPSLDPLSADFAAAEDFEG